MKTLLSKSILVVLTLLSLNATAVTRYVDLNSSNPIAPYADWMTAATNIQDAIDAAVAGDLILVTNGVYRTGGGVVSGGNSNRVAATKPITLQSVNGPGSAVIEGIPHTIMGAPRMRCVYLTNSATLIGFTLTNGSAASGGGVWCESMSAVVSNCIVANNSATYFGGGVLGGTIVDSVVVQNGAEMGGGACSNSVINSRITRNGSWKGGGLYGCYAERSLILTNSAVGGPGGGGGEAGGAYQGTLVNCVVAGNSSDAAGGALRATMSGCTVVGNSGSLGAGVSGCTLANSIVYYNGLSVSSVNHSGSSFYSCCTTNPNPPVELGNITIAPRFVNLAAADFHLLSNSPCINSGNNARAGAASDLDGNLRIVGGTVDIGAYEHQFPASVLSYAWAVGWGLPTDGSADYIDTDGDGMNNYGESRSGTSPTNPTSALRMVSTTKLAYGSLVTWQSVASRNYWLERATNLGIALPFETIATNIFGVAGTKTFTDMTATNDGPYFYRVGVY